MNLRLYIRKLIAESLVADYVTEYVIKFSKAKGSFVLYNIAKDDNGVIMHMDEVETLGPDSNLAEKRAKKITGKDLKAVHTIKSSSLGDSISPSGQFKGTRIKDIPIEYLVDYLHVVGRSSK